MGLPMAQGGKGDADGVIPLDLPLTDTVPEIAGRAPALDGAGLEQVADGQTRFVLPIEALLPDADGAVVLDDLVGALIDLEASTAVAHQGVVAGEVEAAGRDVSGMAYVALENGVTLYYPTDADITVG